MATLKNGTPLQPLQSIRAINLVRNSRGSLANEILNHVHFILNTKKKTPEKDWPSSIETNVYHFKNWNESLKK
jgi:hypothetical protein